MSKKITPGFYIFGAEILYKVKEQIRKQDIRSLGRDGNKMQASLSAPMSSLCQDLLRQKSNGT